MEIMCMAYVNITPGINTLHAANMARYIDIYMKVNTAIGYIIYKVVPAVNALIEQTAGK
jgi:hypothetical protein